MSSIYLHPWPAPILHNPDSLKIHMCKPCFHAMLSDRLGREKRPWRYDCSGETLDLVQERAKANKLLRKWECGELVAYMNRLPTFSIRGMLQTGWLEEQFHDQFLLQTMMDIPVFRWLLVEIKNVSWWNIHS